MLFLSPEKLFVVLVVAVIVLGPEKLPRVARQAATTWRTLASLRTRLESQARTAFPELPSFDTITEAVRSPLAYLDRLAGDVQTSSRQGSTPGSLDGSFVVEDVPTVVCGPGRAESLEPPGDPALN